MKAITIMQPWAELIASGEKRVENRTWPTRHRGLIAIHAGVKTNWGWENFPNIDLKTFERMSYGAIVAVAEIGGCMSMIDVVQARLPGDPLEWLAAHEHTQGPWCWVLENVRRLERPIRCTGKQGLWNVPEEIAQQLG